MINNIRRKNIKIVWLLGYVVSVSLFGLYHASKFSLTDFSYIMGYLTNQNVPYADGFVLHAAVDLLFLIILFIGFAVLITMLAIKKRLNTTILLVFHTILTIFFLMTYPLLINGTVYMTSYGLVTNFLMMDFSLAFEQIIKNIRYVVSAIIFVITLLIIIIVRIKELIKGKSPFEET